MTDAKTKPAAAKADTAADTAKPKVERVAPQLTGAPIPLALPTRPAARTSPYPFDALGAPTRDAAGNVTAAFSFGVKNKTARELAQVVSNANKRYRKETGEGENKTTFQERRFFAVDCDPATDPEGAKARVYRDQ